MIQADNPSSQQMGEESAVNRAVNEMFFSELVSHCKYKRSDCTVTHKTAADGCRRMGDKWRKQTPGRGDGDLVCLAAPDSPLTQTQLAL